MKLEMQKCFDKNKEKQANEFVMQEVSLVMDSLEVVLSPRGPLSGGAEVKSKPRAGVSQERLCHGSRCGGVPGGLGRTGNFTNRGGRAESM